MTTTDFEPHTSADTPRDAWIELTRQTLDLIDTAAAAARHVRDIDDLNAVIDTIVDAHQMAADLLVRDRVLTARIDGPGRHSGLHSFAGLQAPSAGTLRGGISPHVAPDISWTDGQQAGPQ